ncbi:MAG: hypothetical protein JNM33_04170 [Rubrivivax sp.]|nr:hypothetical protein [Rubrivivax sp.]
MSTRHLLLATTSSAIFATLVAGCEPQLPRQDSVAQRAAIGASAPLDPWLAMNHPDCREALESDKELVENCMGNQKAVALLGATVLQPMGGNDLSCSGTNCSYEVKVDGDGKDCSAAFNYGSVTITGSKPGASIRWELKGNPTDFDFDKGYGIQFAQRRGSPPMGTYYPDPALWWKTTTSADNVEARVELKHTNKLNFCHFPRVRHVKTNRLCCPRDPIIINDP